MSRLPAAIVALLAAHLAAAGAAPGSIRFTDITRDAGITFRHVNGASPDKHLVETMGSGGLFADFDNDGWLDIFLVDGGSLADPAVARLARHRLYRNRGNATFEDVTARSGIAPGDYGMGACAGDVDNDGWIDLYVTSFGPNALYRNRGNGTFVDATGPARVATPMWSAGCAFADLDKDGDLDLFVANYVDAGRSRSPFCGRAKLGLRVYCHPLNFPPLPATLYRNNGRGVFTDVSAQAGIAAHRGNGLGVIVTDYDEDGWPDLFVANDSVPNFLFRNTRDGRFVESALGAGVAVATDGKARAGMGVDAGDYDGDGHLDLIVTNLDFETHSLYRSLGGGLFAHATSESGIGPATLPFVGFGAAFVDVDNDARLDVVIANGHVMENAPQMRSGAVYAQRKLLFHNSGGRRFVEIGRTAGPGFALEKVGRGLAAGDVDNDGDLDLLVTNNGQSADLLRNDGDRGNSLLVRAIGRQTNRDAIGARVRVVAGGKVQIRDVRAGSSYLSQSDLRQHFGLGGATSADRIEVVWPTGKVDIATAVAANQIVTVQEGAGIVRRVPFVR
jgi:enediyne biosynthesis protein E4